MIREDALRRLLLSKTSVGDSFHAAVVAAVAWLVMGVAVFILIALLWDWFPPPAGFLIIFDALFVLLALGGAGLKPEGGEQMFDGSRLNRIWIVYGGGFWQVAKSFAKALLFALPWGAVQAVRNAVPPVWTLRDPEAVRLLGAIARLEGGVPLPLFRYLAGNPPAGSLRRALEAAHFLDAATVKSAGGVSTIVPGGGISQLRAIASHDERSSQDHSA